MKETPNIAFDTKFRASDRNHLMWHKKHTLKFDTLIQREIEVYWQVHETIVFLFAGTFPYVFQ